MNKRALALFVIPLLVLLIPGIAFGYTPGGGFAASPHDFSNKGSVGDGGKASGACTFCHTPHRAIQTRLLWNHKLSTQTYTWDTAATVGGTPMPTIDQNWTGPSKFCLSCHDGTVAIGDIAWFNKVANPAMDNTKHDTDDYLITYDLTGSMRGNHPVAFPYPYFNSVGSTYNGVTTGANVVKKDFSLDPTQYGIRLFTDPGAGGTVVAGPTAAKTGIECTSCHGVHNEQGIVWDIRLLRGKISGNLTADAGSHDTYICLKCHTRGANDGLP
jgi:hypothetical protein